MKRGISRKYASLLFTVLISPLQHQFVPLSKCQSIAPKMCQPRHPLRRRRQHTQVLQFQLHMEAILQQCLHLESHDEQKFATVQQ